MNLLLGLVPVLAVVFGLGVQARRAANAEWGRAWLNLLDGLNRLFCRHYHRLDPATLDLPVSGPALVVANHVSGLDPLLLLALSPRPLRFLMARPEYERWWLRPLVRAVGCIPVDGNTRGLLLAAQRALADGQVVALFPQGGIVAAGGRVPLKRGVAVLAETTGVPVYPVRLGGIGWPGAKVRAVWRRSRARATCFPPLQCRPDEADAFLGELQKILGPEALDGGVRLEIRDVLPH